MPEVSMVIADRFSNFILDWDYEQYLVLGGYGSGKSYAIAQKIILKCLSEKRTVLVVREVYDTIKESCFSLFKDILIGLDLMESSQLGQRKKFRNTKVYKKEAPMEFIFPNGSRIIFKGMDKPEKLKSIHDVSIVWIEECSEVKFQAYEELLGRIRHPSLSLHFILSCNPVGKENWVYNHFFIRTDDEGKQHIKVDDEVLYKRKTLVKDGVYYHHSIPEDNPYLPKTYIKRLDKIQEYDPVLWRVARLGKFGASGTRVLPQFEIATNAHIFKDAISKIPIRMHFFGMDFGFEESYNAVISMAVDDKEKVLYIYDEIYRNNITDNLFAQLPKMQKLKKKLRFDFTMCSKQLVADNADPKAIQYYRQEGFPIRGCKNKFAGSRLSNTRKIKRFRRIICSPRCVNTIKELKDLVYKRDSKGNVIYDEFNIDPHTFSAIWYGLDTYTVADIKEQKRSTKAG